MLRDRGSAGNKKREGEKVFTEDRLSKELLYTCMRNNIIKRKHAGNPTNSSINWLWTSKNVCTIKSNIAGDANKKTQITEEHLSHYLNSYCMWQHCGNEPELSPRVTFDGINGGSSWTVANKTLWGCYLISSKWLGRLNNFQTFRATPCPHPFFERSPREGQTFPQSCLHY